MKHLFTLFIIGCATISLSAQSEKGKLLVGGNFSIWTSIDTDNQLNDGNRLKSDYTNFDLRLSPHLGRFINENTIIGLGIVSSYDHRKNNLTINDSLSSSGNSYDSHTGFINAYLTKFHKVTGDLYFTSSFSIQIGAGVRHASFGDSNLFAVGGSYAPGLSYFANEKWLLTAGIGNIYYDFSRENLTDGGFAEEGKSSRHNIGLNLNPSSIRIGFQYFLN